MKKKLLGSTFSFVVNLIFLLMHNDLCLPFLQMLPKFHKPTIDNRYIAAGIKSSWGGGGGGGGGV